MKKLLIILGVMLYCSSLFAVAPSSYYTSAEGKSSDVLRHALQDIIDGHTDNGYGGLYDIYETSDDKNGKVWDMYSTCTWYHGQKQCGNYSTVCDCYNREHSVPQSWFDSKSPMKNDAFQVYPTDGKVNGQRSNYPYGECTGGTTLSNGLGRLGQSTFAGFAGTVFEPDDQYKGDFARTYFYFVTRYADQSVNWKNGVFSSSNNGLTPYTVALFLKWSREDPVSQKEIDRNDAIYQWQHNRNPFIDYPILAEFIWGNQLGNNWYESSTATPKVEANPFTLSATAVQSSFSITSSSQASDLTVTLMNVNGAIMLTQHVSLEESVDISSLNQGLYIVKIQNQGKTYIQKIMKL